jgi:hypothetical protein
MPAHPRHLSPDERLRAAAGLFAAALLRLAQRRTSTPENPSEITPSPAPESPEDSGVSGLACAPRKSVHVQGG